MSSVEEIVRLYRELKKISKLTASEPIYYAIPVSYSTYIQMLTDYMLSGYGGQSFGL